MLYFRELKFHREGQGGFSCSILLFSFFVFHFLEKYNMQNAKRNMKKQGVKG